MKQKNAEANEEKIIRKKEKMFQQIDSLTLLIYYLDKLN